MSCSVENHDSPDDHQVVNDDFQVQGAVLSVEGPGIERFAEPAFHHADDGLDLPALAVTPAFGRTFEVMAHLSSESGARQLFGRPPYRGRDQGAHAVFPPGV